MMNTKLVLTALLSFAFINSAFAGLRQELDELMPYIGAFRVPVYGPDDEQEAKLLKSQTNQQMREYLLERKAREPNWWCKQGILFRLFGSAIHLRDNNYMDELYGEGIVLNLSPSYSGFHISHFQKEWERIKDDESTQITVSARNDMVGFKKAGRSYEIFWINKERDLTILMNLTYYSYKINAQNIRELPDVTEKKTKGGAKTGASLTENGQ